MRISPHRLFPQLRCCLGAALLCLFAFGAYAADEPSPIQAEIMLLQDMAETQQDESLKQLIALLKNLPADADPVDVSKVQHKLENARVKLAKVSAK